MHICGFVFMHTKTAYKFPDSLLCAIGAKCRFGITCPNSFQIFDTKNVLLLFVVVVVVVWGGGWGGGITARQDYFTHFEPSQSSDAAKMADPQGKLPGHPQAELGLSHITYVTRARLEPTAVRWRAI